MIDFIKGTVARKTSDGIVVELKGVGIKVLTPFHLLSKIKENQEIYLYTKLSLPTEGTPVIYGFETEEERKLFNILTKIPKVGSRTALNILSHFSKEELKTIVANKDIKTLSTVPGLGKKLSERLIFELSRKLETDKEDETYIEALEVLENLGYKRQEIVKAIKSIENKENMNFDELIKKLISILSGGKFGI